jgi:hypothetical protein
MAARLMVFLANWFLPDFSLEVRAAIISDWLTALAGTPAWALDYAIARYLATSRAKPLPVDLLAMLPYELKTCRDLLAQIDARYQSSA